MHALISELQDGTISGPWHSSYIDITAGGGLELGSRLAGQLQPIGQQPHRVPLRHRDHAALQVAHRPRAQAGGLRELALRQSRRNPQPAQHAREPSLRLSHIHSPARHTAAQSPQKPQLAYAAGRSSAVRPGAGMGYQARRDSRPAGRRGRGDGAPASPSGV
jgi:hypothetical protein